MCISIYIYIQIGVYIRISYMYVYTLKPLTTIHILARPSHESNRLRQGTCRPSGSPPRWRYTGSMPTRQRRRKKAPFGGSPAQFCGRVLPYKLGRRGFAQRLVRLVDFAVVFEKGLWGMLQGSACRLLIYAGHRLGKIRVGGWFIVILES